ncbi:hypothetical protein BaRGS_00001203 [Batillaria attramentaria]|uniref:Uncharacterized protein n=1 Tax=Batillaria attramentaria TaxID=370345 RepID=A0ABD0M703_9CAEN
MGNGAHGTVTDVRFINWDVDSQPANDDLHNEIAGAGNRDHVTNWQFVNVKVGGHCIANAERRLLGG